MRRRGLLGGSLALALAGVATIAKGKNSDPLPTTARGPTSDELAALIDAELTKRGAPPVAVAAGPSAFERIEALDHVHGFATVETFDGSAHTHSTFGFDPCPHQHAFYPSGLGYPSLAFISNGVNVLSWRGSEAIPLGYQLCDGTNGTPDLRSWFVGTLT